MTIFSNVLDSLFPSLRGDSKYTDTPFPYSRPVNLQKSATWVNIGGAEFELYKTTPELFAIINKIATLRTNGVFKHYKLNSQGEKEEVLDSDYVKLLNNPNVLQSSEIWQINRTVNQLIYGNDYTNALKGSRLTEIPSALWNLAPNKMIINRTGKIWKQTDIDKIITSYELLNDGYANDIFKPSEILHIKSANSLDPLVGVSPFEALQRPISNIRLSYAFRNVIMDEHGALGFISGDNKDTMGTIPMTPEQRLDIEKQYSKSHGIRKGQAKVRIHSTPTKWQSTSFKTKDLMLFEEIDADKRALLDAYGVNENVFSGSKSTYENVKEGLKSTYQDAVIPLSNKDCNGLSEFLGLTEKGEFIEQDYSHIECLQENEGTKATTANLKADAYTKLKATGDFTEEEIKEIVKL